ncbi:MAG: phosphatidate cytidylyltransferase [Ferruginibacter sp.]|nr:phosphatidate cytidylyltransferase [Ferruginibacter sp.]
MAINVATLKTRSLTALIFVLVMFAGLFINGYTFSALFIIVMLGCLYEFVKLMKKISPSGYGYYLPLGLLYIVLPILMLLELGLEMKIETAGPTPDNDVFYQPLFPCAIIFSIWINDTMAYIVGSFIGKTPFSPISPKKTWEGTIGGAILCVALIGLLGSLIPPAKSVPLKHWLVIAATAAVFGTLGDLLESKLKRVAGVKDSGTFMPGHGGFLDRFDSLLIATPFVWAYIHFVMIR